MTVVIASKKNLMCRGAKGVAIKVTYGNGDTSLVVDTGLKTVFSYSVSPTSVTTKLVDIATVAGGVITVTAADPLADCYLYVTAWGLG